MRIYLLSLLSAFTSITINAQIKPLVINNNTNYTVAGRIHIYSTTVCNGDYMLASVIIPPNTSVTYDKYENTNLSNPPIDHYLLNGPNPVNYNDPILASNGSISTSTDWEMFDLWTKNSSDEIVDTFKVGVFRRDCGRTPLALHYGNYSTAQWTVFSSHHEVNID